MLDELSKLKANLDEYYTYSDDFRVWKKEHKKWEYYKAKLLIFQVELTKARNFYLGVIT
jgi:hypothetical protein